MKIQKGFSLIELMIAVVIVGILAAVAFPSYQNYVVKSNRAAAQAFMVDAASREKQYLLDARSYVSVADNSGFSALGMTVPGDVGKHYTIAISAPAATPPSFTITATPTSSQQTADGALTLTSDGTKGPSGKW
ncbi:type IV pilin protein [Candidatus Ferrigenium straubiae]|jgi:type IV pilus assembly protein PilE|uniref:type IV pilin protein n=1 Tax=Candidatus Ferrigenium straubiae TaxID=2919506 RepID=UPI003F4AF2AD